MAFKLHMTVDLSMTSFYVHAHSDDVDLDFESVCKASPTCLRDFFYTAMRCTHVAIVIGVRAYIMQPGTSLVVVLRRNNLTFITLV